MIRFHTRGRLNPNRVSRRKKRRTCHLDQCSRLRLAFPVSIISPGTFDYPLCFAAFFAALGLFVQSNSGTSFAPSPVQADLDAASLLRRGRSLYQLDRYEEALVCSRLIREKYGTTPEAKTAHALSTRVHRLQRQGRGSDLQYYARARLAQALKRNDRADLYLKGIATANAKDPAVLSPALLAASGDILIKLGQLDEAQVMFQRLIDHYKDGMFADAGPVGLGYIALAKKKPADGLKIFAEYLKNNPGMFRFKEATLGKLEAMTEMDQLEAAEKLAVQIIDDYKNRGEVAGEANLLLARIYLKQAEKANGEDAKLKCLKKAHSIYQRVYVVYQTSPEICAEGYLQAYKTLLLMGKKDLAEMTLKEFMEFIKLHNPEH